MRSKIPTQRQCLCSRCDQLFISLEDFDTHRIPSRNNPEEESECDFSKLVYEDEIWGTEENQEERIKVRDRLKGGRERAKNE